MSGSRKNVYINHECTELVSGNTSLMRSVVTILNINGGAFSAFRAKSDITGSIVIKTFSISVSQSKVTSS